MYTYIHVYIKYIKIDIYLKYVDNFFESLFIFYLFYLLIFFTRWPLIKFSYATKKTRLIIL